MELFLIALSVPRRPEYLDAAETFRMYPSLKGHAMTLWMNIAQLRPLFGKTASQSIEMLGVLGGAIARDLISPKCDLAQMSRTICD